MQGPFDLSVALLHEGMVDKQNKPVTTSLTLIDVHDIARSSRTYGAKGAYIVHPSAAMQKLARTLQHHWMEGHGGVYNPNRKDALTTIEIVSALDEVTDKIRQRTGRQPCVIATSAKDGPDRVSFTTLRQSILAATTPHLLLLGTGWGMGEALLKRCDVFLEPIKGASDYNHLSVRSACAILLDRLVGYH